MHPIQPNPTLSRLRPPEWLSPAEQLLFTEIVNSVESRHLNESDLPVLVSFVQVTAACRAQANRASQDLSKDAIDGWDKLLRTQLALARSLRLTAQARIDPLTIGRRANGYGRPLTFSDTIRTQNKAPYEGDEEDAIPSPRSKPWE